MRSRRIFRSRAARVARTVHMQVGAELQGPTHVSVGVHASFKLPHVGPGGQLGQGHPAHQHPVLQGPPHAGLRQGLARAH